MQEIIFWAIWILAGIIMLIYYARRKHTIISALFGMITGIAALFLLNYFGDSVGFIPEISLFNTMNALILGVPGVIMIWIAGRFL